MKSISFLLFGILSLTLVASTAQAFQMGACHDDIEKYCKGVKLKDDGMKDCLKKHLAQLSDPCKANLVDIYIEKKKSESQK